MKNTKQDTKISGITKRFTQEIRRAFRDNPSQIFNKRDLSVWVLADQKMPSGFAALATVHAEYCFDGIRVDLGKAMLDAYDGMELSEAQMSKIITGIREVLREYESLFERDFGKPCD